MSELEYNCSYPVTNPGYVWVLDSANHIDLKQKDGNEATWMSRSIVMMHKGILTAHPVSPHSSPPVVPHVPPAQPLYPKLTSQARDQCLYGGATLPQEIFTGPNTGYQSGAAGYQ